MQFILEDTSIVTKVNIQAGLAGCNRIVPM